MLFFSVTFNDFTNFPFSGPAAATQFTLYKELFFFAFPTFKKN